MDAFVAELDGDNVEQLPTIILNAQLAAREQQRARGFWRTTWLESEGMYDNAMDSLVGVESWRDFLARVEGEAANVLEDQVEDKRTTEAKFNH